MKKTYTLLLAAVTVVALSSTSVEADLIGHWKLDGTGITALDSAGSNDGSIVGGVIQGQPGMIGNAYHFDGATGYVAPGGGVLNDLGKAWPITISCWVKAPQVTQTSRMVWFGRDNANHEFYSSHMNGLGSGGIYAGEATLEARVGSIYVVRSGFPIDDDQWHHVVTVFESDTMRRLYVDGQFVGSDSRSAPFVTQSNDFEIGRNGRASATDHLTGLIDDVGAWNEALSAVRIALIHGLGRFVAVDLGDPAIDDVIDVFVNQSGLAVAGGEAWSFTDGLAGGLGAISGSIGGGDASIVLDDNGNGVTIFQDPDSDVDGVPDSSDLYPNSDLRSTVWVGNCDSDVPNVINEALVDENGCSLADLVGEIISNAALSAKNHGQFVSEAAKALKEFVDQGLLTSAQRGALVSCIASSK